MSQTETTLLVSIVLLLLLLLDKVEVTLGVTNDNGCQNLDGGGWTLVRRVSHVDNYGIWHQPNDDVYGTATDYGTYDTDAQGDTSWGVYFADEQFNEYLFATGDCEIWLVASTDAVNGDTYSNEDRCIYNSSYRNVPYFAKWYNRGSTVAAEDPWVTITDHHAEITSEDTVYGEASNTYHSDSIKNHNGANVWIRQKDDETRECRPTIAPTEMPSDPPTVESVYNDNGCSNLDGGGWTLVRRVSDGDNYGTWHQTNDDVYGTATAYGTRDGDAQGDTSWGIYFADIEFNEYLFATGDCEIWLVASTDAVNGDTYSNEDRCIYNSSYRNVPYYAKWYNRGSSNPEDPWISITDHVGSDDTLEDTVYGEASNTLHSKSIENHGGGNVWIRQKDDETRECRPTSAPTDIPTEPPTYESVYNDNGCQNLDGGGWTLVRRVSDGDNYGTWHQTYDDAEGTASAYGTYDSDAQGDTSWGIYYADEEFNQYLFATGDCEIWLVTTTFWVNGDTYSNEDRCIYNSSYRNVPYFAKWYNRGSSNPEDPWVTITDHVGSDDTLEDTVYGEASNTLHSVSIENHGGANVWIRQRDNDAREDKCRPTTEPTNIPSESPTNDPTRRTTAAAPNLPDLKKKREMEMELLSLKSVSDDIDGSDKIYSYENKYYFFGLISIAIVGIIIVLFIKCQCQEKGYKYQLIPDP